MDEAWGLGFAMGCCLRVSARRIIQRGKNTSDKTTYVDNNTKGNRGEPDSKMD